MIWFCKRHAQSSVAAAVADARYLPLLLVAASITALPLTVCLLTGAILAFFAACWLHALRS
jgi:hypothetical protein